MRLLWSDRAWEDYLHWQAADPPTLRRLDDLIKDASRSPFAGLGKPEPLKGHLKGWWSRRITGSHRLVYRVGGTGLEQTLEIAQCRWHYELGTLRYFTKSAHFGGGSVPHGASGTAEVEFLGEP